MKSSQSVEIEVAGTKISIQNANDETRKLIEDLQDRVNALEGPPPARAGDYEAPPAPPRPRKILWVDDRPNANVHERARVMEAGYGLVQADTTDAVLLRQIPSVAYTTSSTELMQLLGISGNVVLKVPDRS